MKTVACFIVILFSASASLEDEKSEESNENYNEYPRYNYEYGVHDPVTKDIKKHWEKKGWRFCKSFVQPDGSLRIVDYNSDDKNGFSAFVKYEDLGEHPSEEVSAGEYNEFPTHTENLQDSFEFNFLPEEYFSVTPASVEKENEENVKSSPKNKSIHAYEGKGRPEGGGKGYEVEENPESNENVEEEEEEESD